MLLLLWISCIFFHDVKASGCQRVIHKQVGDTVEFSSCLPPADVSYAAWKYGYGIVVMLEEGEVMYFLFRGRTSLNLTDLSLTMRNLTLKDSGDYMLISEVNTAIRERTTISLQVHAPLTPPLLTVNSTWSAAAESCAVLLDCVSTSDTNVVYTWTVKNQTYSGSRLQYTLRPPEGDTTFNCTVFNYLSEQLASKTVKCVDNTNTTEGSVYLPLMSGLIVGSLLMILLLLLVVFCSDLRGGYCNRTNQSQTVKQDETQEHVYSSLLRGDASLYETLRV